MQPRNLGDFVVSAHSSGILSAWILRVFLESCNVVAFSAARVALPTSGNSCLCVGLTRLIKYFQFSNFLGFQEHQTLCVQLIWFNRLPLCLCFCATGWRKGILISQEYFISNMKSIALLTSQNFTSPNLSKYFLSSCACHCGSFPWLRKPTTINTVVQNTTHVFNSSKGQSVEKVLLTPNQGVSREALSEELSRCSRKTVFRFSSYSEALPVHVGSWAISDHLD